MFVVSAVLFILASVCAAVPVHAAGWAAQESPTGRNLYAIDISESVGYAVGQSGVIAYTKDGGKNWETGKSSVRDDLYGVAFMGSKTGVAVGDAGTILRTENSGSSWTEIAVAGLSEDLRAVRMATSSAGYAVGEGGLILKTEDGGKTWKEQDVSTDEDLFDVTAPRSDASRVWAVGRNGTIVATADGGKTWKLQKSGTSQDLYAASAPTSSAVWAAGEGDQILKSSDGGSTWSEFDADGLSSGEDVNDVTFLSSSKGMLEGSEGTHLQTDDGGKTWEEVEIDDGPVFQRATYAAEDLRWAVGEEGAIYRYDAESPSKPGNFALTDASLTTDDEPVFTWSASTDGESAIETYEFKLDSASYKDIGNKTSYAVSELEAGFHTARVRAVDRAGNAGEEAKLTFTVSSSASGNVSVSDVSPTSAKLKVATTFSVRPKGFGSGLSCRLTIDDKDVGAMEDEKNSDLFSLSHTFFAVGTYKLQVFCKDNGGHKASSSVERVTVSSSDAAAPSVSAVTPSTAVKGVAVTLSADVSDNVKVASCSLYLDGKNTAAMAVASGRATVKQTFQTAGSYVVYARCADANGNAANGPSSSLAVLASSTNAAPGDLLKMGCGANVEVNDPCTAVYFYGPDGKRHAFPNERVFSAWYKNFDGLVIVTSDVMASIPLGRNVTQPPGKRLVKFWSQNTVYALTRGGVLRPIANGDIAAALYGSSWPELIDDVNDVFFGNYKVGEVIDSSKDYDRKVEEKSVSGLGDNF